MAFPVGRRGHGAGSVNIKQYGLHRKWEARTPGTKHCRGVLLGTFDSRYAAERAMNAWWTVQALLALVAIADRQAA